MAKAPRERQRAIRAKIYLAQSRVKAEQEAVKRYRRIKPFIDNYLPNDPFKTLALITALLLLGTIVKDLFLIGFVFTFAPRPFA